MPGASLDLGGLRLFPNRVYSFVDGPLPQEVGVATLNEIVPSIIFAVSNALGVPVNSSSFDFRLSAAVTVAGGGVSADIKIPLMQDEEEGEDPVAMAEQYGKFPVMRSGGNLQILTSSKPAEQGQTEIGRAVQGVINQENLESLVLAPVMSAIRQALAQ